MKSIKYKLSIISPALYLWLSLFSVVVNAQEIVLSDEDEVTTEADTQDSAEAELKENTVELEQQSIYRVEHPIDPCSRELDLYDYEKSWYDETQIFINSSFCEPALWFDNFFASDRVLEEGPVGTYVRWRNDFIEDEEEGFKFDTRLSFSVELPGVKQSLRLTFEGDEDEDLRDLAPVDGQEANNNLGLQLDLKENARSKLSVRVNLEPGIRLRYRYTYPVRQNITLRFTQELEREKAIHNGRTQLDLEQVFDQRFLLRASTQGKVSEEFDGIDWLQAFVLFQRINSKTSLSYESSVSGISEPNTLATDYRLGVRLRKNFHREWLFYEIAPEMTWPVTLDESRQNVVTERRSKWLILFRFEVHFGNAYRKRYQDHI